MTHLTPITAGIEQGFLNTKAAELARDIVMQIDVASNLAAMYGLTPDQWAVLKASPFFRELVSRAQTDLSGSVGTAERARRKAALAIEQVGVISMASILHSDTATPGQKTDAYKALAGTAGLDKPAATAMNPQGQGGPLINIIVQGRELAVGAIVPSQPAIEGSAT